MLTKKIIELMGLGVLPRCVSCWGAGAFLSGEEVKGGKVKW